MSHENRNSIMGHERAVPLPRPEMNLEVELLEDRIAPARLGLFLQNQPFTPHSAWGDPHLEDCCN